MPDNASGNPSFLVLASLSLAGMLVVFPHAAQAPLSPYGLAWLGSLIVLGAEQLFRSWRWSEQGRFPVDDLLLVLTAVLWSIGFAFGWQVAPAGLQIAMTVAIAALVLVMAATYYARRWACLTAIALLGLPCALVVLADPGSLPFMGVALTILSALCMVVVARFSRWIDRDAEARGRVAGLLEQVAQRRLELQEVEINRSRFLASISHDLRQPMHAINLYIGSIERSLLSAQQAPDERLRASESVLRLKQSVGYMNDIFDSLLDVSQLDTGVVRVSLDRVQALPFCKRLLEQFTRTAEELGIRIELCGEGAEQIFLQTDTRLLERIVRNFLSNALRYTRKGGIRLRLRVRDGVCRISVVDTGVGIPIAMKKKIFDEFMRLDQSASSLGSKGVGLGLSIARRLAARIGAHISLHSYVGMGSVFAVDVPLSTKRPSLQERHAQREERILQAVLPNITMSHAEDTLLVCLETDPDISNAMSLLAPALGLRLLVATSSAAVIAELGRLHRIPDLLLIDSQLPSETALQALASINDEFNLDIPAIVLSSDMSMELATLDRCLPVTVLQKPFSSDRLHEAINDGLSKSKEQRAQLRLGDF